ncbi:tyrosine-type recombinase/integrase [Shigella flexneri]
MIARPVGSEDDALFLSNWANASPRVICRTLCRWGMNEGLIIRVHPHKFGHSLATHMLESSGNLRGVQELLGHANLSTAQIYTRL